MEFSTMWLIAGALVVIITLWMLVGYPRWNVWASHQSGLADLMQAKNEQQVQVSEAQGRLDAASINKKAAIIEAEAVACQIEAIGKKLIKHDLYLKWQWIKMMEDRSNREDGDASVIYIPTEAGMPILEAGNRKRKS